MSQRENVIVDKSYRFAVRIVKLSAQLNKLKQYDPSSQMLRSGTSIGSNVEEAQGGASKKDFTNKIRIAYTEARETKYWLRLVSDAEITDQKTNEALLTEC
jgi:four helix bundle protein